MIVSPLRFGVNQLPKKAEDVRLSAPGGCGSGVGLEGSARKNERARAMARARCDVACGAVWGPARLYRARAVRILFLSPGPGEPGSSSLTRHRPGNTRQPGNQGSIRILMLWRSISALARLRARYAARAAREPRAGEARGAFPVLIHFLMGQ